SIDELRPITELYYHTVRSGGFDKAFTIYHQFHVHTNLCQLLTHVFAAYQLSIDLLEELFPENVYSDARIIPENQGVLLNHLANSYAAIGQPRLAKSLFERALTVDVALVKKAPGRSDARNSDRY